MTPLNQATASTNRVVLKTNSVNEAQGVTKTEFTPTGSVSGQPQDNMVLVMSPDGTLALKPLAQVPGKCSVN